MIRRTVSNALSRMYVRLMCLVLVSVLPAVAIVVLDGARRHDEVASAARDQALGAARVMAARQRDAIDQARHLLIGLSETPGIDDPGAIRACADMLSRAVQLSVRHNDLFVIGAGGDVLCRNKPIPGPVNVADRAYFRHAIQQRTFAIGDYQSSRFTGLPVLVFAQPVLRERHAASAVVAVAVDPSTLLSPFLRDSLLPPDTVVAMLDARGTVLASVPDADDLEGWRAPFLPALRGPLDESREAVLETRWKDGTSRISAVASVADGVGALYVAVGIPSERVRATSAEVTRRNLWTLAGTTTLVLLLAGLIGHRLVLRRVNDLSRTARRLAAGDLAARSTLPPADGELGQLASTLDGMAAAFDESMTQAIQARRALHRSNRALRLIGEVNRIVAAGADDDDLAANACSAAVDAGYLLACVRLSNDARSTATCRRACVAEDGRTVIDREPTCFTGTCPIHTQTAAAPAADHAQGFGRARCAHAGEVAGSSLAVSMPGPMTGRAPGNTSDGALMIVAPERDAFDAEETRLVKEAAAQLSFGIAALRDRSAHRRTQTDLLLRDRAIEASRNGLAIIAYGPTNQIVSVNPALLHMLGLAAQPTDLEALVHVAMSVVDNGDWEGIRALVGSRRAGRIAVTLRRPGREASLDLAITLVREVDGAPTHAVLDIRDVTEQRNYERQLAHQATHDPVTGLPNRNLLTDRLQQALARVARDSGESFLLWLDFDRFDTVEDAFGRDRAETALVELVRRIRRDAVECTTIARMTDDEFVLIAEQLPSRVSIVSLVQRLLETVRRPLVLDAKEIVLTASIGVATILSEPLRDAQAMLRCAQVAMLRAKKQGGDTVCYYEPEMTARATPRIHLEIELRQAIARGQLSLAFQPIVDLLTGQISGAEALCRWNHPELGNVEPTDFIPVAEESGLIVPIGRWVLDGACAQLRAWLDAGPGCNRMAVNVSPQQFARDDLSEQITDLLVRYRIDPPLLMIELTETTLMADPGRTARTLHALRAIGVRVAIDDFGVGYSSLAVLARFPIDYLKIDRSFIRDLASNPDDASVARSIVSLAHHLNMRVVAEGVETVGQLVYLRGQGCDEMQGNLFSMPVDAARFSAMIAESRYLEFPAQKDLPERTLLLVDDEPSVQSALRRALRRQGYTALFASNAGEALDILTANIVGVVISDFRMPGMDGVQLLRKVATLYPATVRMLLSGYADVATVTDAINTGSVFRFMHKPWDDRELLEAVRSAFEHFELNRAAAASAAEPASAMAPH